MVIAMVSLENKSFSIDEFGLYVIAGLAPLLLAEASKYECDHLEDVVTTKLIQKWWLKWPPLIQYY